MTLGMHARLDDAERLRVLRRRQTKLEQNGVLIGSPVGFSPYLGPSLNLSATLVGSTTTIRTRDTQQSWFYNVHYVCKAIEMHGGYVEHGEEGENNMVTLTSTGPVDE